MSEKTAPLPATTIMMLAPPPLKTGGNRLVSPRSDKLLRPGCLLDNLLLRSEGGKMGC